MKIKLGTLRKLIREEIMPRGGRSAPTDPDAQVPGHLPNELPPSASLVDEEAWVPGRWMPGEGEPVDPEGMERMGEPCGMDETDAFTQDDGLGNGEPDRNDPDSDEFDIADHLKGDKDKTALGDPPPDEEVVEMRILNRQIRQYLLQEYPAGAGMVDPTKKPMGFYTDFDMEKDHHTGDDIQGTWYKSPGRAPGSDGDPFRGPDPYAQLGFHPPDRKDTTSHPAVNGEEGNAARRAEPAWQLTGGGDTSSMLGANAHPASSEVGSQDEPGNSEEGTEGEESEESSQEGDEPG